MPSGIAVSVVALGYLLGTFPTAVLVGRRLGFDPTATGSGNPGASNTTRIAGRRAGLVVLVGDAAKGMAASGVGLAAGDRTLAWAAGAGAVAGHLWPATRRFRGGKGVATGAGVSVVCAPVVWLMAAVAFAALVAVTGKAAIGSLAAAVVIPLGALALGQPVEAVAIAAGVSAAIVVRHRENIARLVAGTEANLHRGGPPLP